MMWRGLARRSLPYLITAAGGFILAYLAVAFLIFPSSVLPSDRRVPNVVGLSHEEATRKIEDAGFSASTGERRYHASAPDGQVLGQSPLPDAVEARGATVSLEVSRGQRQGAVPPVAGLTVARAEEALESAGFEVGGVTPRESAEPRGQVIGSEPGEGARVPIPAAVSLVVSTGPTGVTLPDVTGQGESEARSLLEQLGFSLEVGVDSFSSMPLGMVVSQTPAAGRRVGAGSRVRLTVSGAPTPYP
ncbi:MAG: PASTA domain-containing protein [Gemmatimonadota bacterium]|nr:PASTA domain-containing protein [Gemmatimonadota bacterium]